MTSGNFTSYPLASIVVSRETRQRRELRNIETLAESIAKVGLINPPVITREGQLIAGERRLAACTMLGWTNLPVQFAEDLDQITLHLLELEENAKREDLTWQEHNAAIAEYHRLQRLQNPEWNVADSAQNLGISESAISKHLMVAKEIEHTPMVAEADRFSTALGITQRKRERAAASILRDVNESLPTPDDTPKESLPPDRFAELRCEDALKFFATYSGIPFNLIHCDFPYGVTATKKGQSSAKELGGYDDSSDTYFTLLNAFVAETERFVDPSAHLVFWFSMDYYSDTKTALQSADWRVDPFPFVWFKPDNKGIIPDATRGPRRTYETAFFASRGDRKIVRAVSNATAVATTKDFHMSEKPYAMVSHFFRMLVDDSTRMLDPTCGGGNAVKAAEELGAEYSLGLERNAEFYKRACENLKLEPSNPKPRPE